MQLSYNATMPVAYAGMLADTGVHDILTYTAKGDIPFGRGLALNHDADDSRVCRLPAANLLTLTFSADLITGNKINGQVNGTPIAEVTFATDHLTTMQAIADEIAGIPGVTSVTVGGANNRVITVTSEAAVTASGWAITDGASQATITPAITTPPSFVGVSVAVNHLEQGPGGIVQYEDKDPVNVLSRGRAYVLVDQDVSLTDAPHVRFSGGQSGAFRADDDSGQALSLSRCRFVQGAKAGGLAILEVNLP